jgi:hypothetical protein
MVVTGADRHGLEPRAATGGVVVLRPQPSEMARARLDLEVGYDHGTSQG